MNAERIYLCEHLDDVEGDRIEYCRGDIVEQIRQGQRDAQANAEQLQAELQAARRESRTNDGVLFSDLASGYVKQLADKCEEVKRLRAYVDPLPNQSNRGSGGKVMP